MVQNLPIWVEVVGSIGIPAVIGFGKAWLGHLDRRDVLAKTLATTESAHKAKVIEAWASLERSTLADQLHKLKK